MATIEEILSQRDDLSTFLVHMTKKSQGMTALEVLTQILVDQKIEARNPFGQAVLKLKEAEISTESQKCVCFTETPLVHLRLLLGDIQGRQTKLEPYGIAIPKKIGRKNGVNPVWYLDMTKGVSWLVNPFNEIISQAISNHINKPFDDDPVAKLAPFVEQMGTWQEGRKEFWWEREWRKCGDFLLPVRVIVIAPEAEHDNFKDFKCIALIDPFWSLEQVIGRLAGFRSENLGL